MAVALAASIGFNAQASAFIVAPVHAVVVAIADAVTNVPAATASPSPTPSGPALPSATPTPKPYLLQRGGRIQLSLTGSLGMGTTSNAQTLLNGAGFAPSPNPSGSPSPFIGAGETTTTTNLSSGNLGLFAELTRRTALSSTDVRIPFSLSTQGRAVFGGTQLQYSTSKFALGYGAQSTSIFGQLPTGSTLRSVYGILPLRNGDLTLYKGPSMGALSEQIPISGLRLRGTTPSFLYELGLVHGSGPETGNATTVIGGIAATRNALSFITEAGWQTRVGGDQSPSGITYQTRLDDGTMNSYLTLIARHMSNGFVNFGSGETYGDNYWDFGYHRSGGSQSFSFDTSTERVGSFGGDSTTLRQANLSYGGPLRFGGYTISMSSQRTAGDFTEATSLNNLTTQISASAGHGFLLVSNQLTRQTTLGPGGAQAQVGYNATYQLPLGAWVTGVSYTALRLISDVTGSSGNSTEGFNLSRQFGKTALGVTQTYGHNESDISNALMRSTQLTVSRIISPAITVQAAYGTQALNDRLNPAENGRSHFFNLQLNAPFGYGNGLVSGRSDPRLPATITGRVLTDVSSGGYSSYASTGMANVEVVLDDKYVQRTDVSGGFQFSFVTPGQHQVRLESGSLPRGVTVDIPINTVQVQGGQTAQMTFLVGNFGGIDGFVYGRNDSGAIIPLPNVMLRVDGGAYSQTDSSGAFGFGKLRPGKHTIAIVENTVPAFATFDASKAKVDVDVKNGAYTSVVFTAEPLGSIAGSIVFGKDMDKDAGQPVENVYVVAEPGEHAAIVNDDGSFIIDNLPPGNYTVAIDPETLPDSTLGFAPESYAIALGSQEHYQGAAFTVGHGEKKVVFSFLGGGSSNEDASAPEVRVSEKRLPPRGTATITVNAPSSVGPVKASAFGSPIDLTYDEHRKAWVGELTVPTNVKVGPYDITATVTKGTQPQAATLAVDANMPIAIVQLDPPNPIQGQYVRVRARFLVHAVEGDRIEWGDGQVTTLGKPVSGRVFTFSVRVSLRPLHGVLLTKGARLPISLM